MVKLRLARFGKKHQPHYRLVAMPQRSKRNGEPIEYLGHYDPAKKPEEAKIDKERVEYWLSVGAQPTRTVHGILARHGITEPLDIKYNKKPGRKAQERAEAKAQKEEEAKADAETESTEADKD
jgi:small subunit ribosomal protein S16